VKRRDILRKLEAAGLTIKEGAKHSRVYKGGVKVSVVSRAREIPETVVREIERQTGVKLK
jgi:hypothetical protein